MDKSGIVWEVIHQQILSEALIDEAQLTGIGRQVLVGNIKVEDWSLAIENTLLREEENGE